MREYLRAFIGATSKEEAERLLKMLIEMRLIAGGKYIKAQSIHRWKGTIEDECYYNVIAYTMDNKKEEIVKTVQDIHSDEVPAIYFHEIYYANKPFFEWIENAVR